MECRGSIEKDEILKNKERNIMKLKNNCVVPSWIQSADDSTKTDNPTDDGIKHTLTESWHMYLNSTTLHCVCHLGKREYTLKRRIFWALLFIGFMTAFIVQVNTLTKRFFEYSTVTKEVTLYDGEPEFPTVTICNLNKIDNDTVTDPEVRTLLKKTFMTTIYDIAYFESLNSSFLNSVNLTKLFTTKPQTKIPTTIRCFWQFKERPCTEYFRMVLTSFGVCFAFNSRKYIEEHGKALRSYSVGSYNGLIVGLMTHQEQYFIGDSAAAGFKVAIHDPDEEPSIGDMGVAVSPGSATLIGMRKTENIYLPSPVKAFGDEYCTDIKSSDFKNYLKYYDIYSWEACSIECETDYVVQKCGCKDVLQPGNWRVCNAYEYAMCVTDAKANYSIHGIELCNCVMPCKLNKYNLLVSNAWFPRENFAESVLGNNSLTTEYLRKNLAELRVYYESKLYTQQTQVLELSFNDLSGTLGGFMGLCFGASVGTIVELFEFLINTCVNLIKRRTVCKKSTT